MAYTKKDTKYLIEEYEKDPGIHTVRKLCIALNRTPKSIIAKLSKEGVYQKQGYRDKTGAIPVKKSDLVADIGEIFGCTLIGLDKAPKQTLKALLEFVRDQDNTLEECLAALSDAAETSHIKSAMLRSRIHAID
jgi:hypothetical protein